MKISKYTKTERKIQEKLREQQLLRNQEIVAEYTANTDHCSVGIIIINFNTTAQTTTCINTLYNYTNSELFDCLLLDNGSHKGIELIDSFKGKKKLECHRFSENVGLTKAWNYGVEHFKRKDVILVGSDVTFYNNDWLPELLDAVNNNPGWGMIHAHCLRENMTEDARYAKYYPKNRESVTKIGRIRHDVVYIRRAVFDTIGLYDEGMFLYGNDVDIQKRAIEFGWFLGYCGTSKVLHYHGLSSKRVDGMIKKRDTEYFNNKWKR